MAKWYKEHIFGRKCELINSKRYWHENPTSEELNRDIEEEVPYQVAVANASLVDPAHFKATVDKISALMDKWAGMWQYINAARTLYARTRKSEHYDIFFKAVDIQHSYQHELQVLFSELGVDMPDLDFGRYIHVYEGKEPREALQYD
jgi:hypothetical protein